VLLEKKASRQAILPLRCCCPTVVFSRAGLYQPDRSFGRPQTGTIKIRLVFSNKKGLLKAGMSTNIRIRNNGTPSLLIPPRIVEQMGEFFVFVLATAAR